MEFSLKGDKRVELLFYQGKDKENKKRDSRNEVSTYSLKFLLVQEMNFVLGNNGEVTAGRIDSSNRVRY